MLYLVCGSLPDKGPWYAETTRQLVAINAETGKTIWKEAKWVVPATLAVRDDCVYFFEKDRVTCLAASTGKVKWQSESIPRAKKFPSCYTPTLVATEKVILISGGEAADKSIFGRWTTKGEN